MASVTRRTRPTHRPSPTPGKMNALFPCPMRYVRPRWTTGSNGLPVATIARPSDHPIASSAVHSLLLVGFDSGNTIGRSLTAAIARTTASVNRPAVPDVPMRIVGLKLRMVSSSVTCAGSRADVGRHFLNRPRVGRLEVLHLRPRLRHQSPAVHRADALPGLFVRRARRRAAPTRRGWQSPARTPRRRRGRRAGRASPRR